MNIYWDANPFLSYVNEHPERMPTLDALLESSAGGNIKIYTSALSQVEVAFAASEQKQRALDPQEEQKIDSLWSSPDAIEVVEFNNLIGQAERALIRGALPFGWSLKPADAIHLATAQWLLTAGFTVAEFHTYDRSLDKCGQIVGFKICEPYIAQPSML